MKLFIVEKKEIYVIAANDYDEAFDELEEIDRYDTAVWEIETMKEATTLNVSRHWAGMEPSNLMDGTKLRDIAPELFKEQA